MTELESTSDPLAFYVDWHSKGKHTARGNVEKLLCLRLRYRKRVKSASSVGRVVRRLLPMAMLFALCQLAYNHCQVYYSPFNYTLPVGIYLCGKFFGSVNADVGKVKFREDQGLSIVRRVVESFCYMVMVQRVRASR